MTFQAVPGGIKLEINATQNGVPIVNVLHVAAGTPVNHDKLVNSSNVLADWLADNVGVFHPSYVLQNVTATDISIEDGEQVVNTFPGGLPGTASGAAMAANAAMCVSLRTARTGRSYRGRMYLGGLSESALQDAQNFTTGSVSGVAGIITTLIDALETAGFVLSVLSRVTNGVQRLLGVLTEITSVIVDTKIDSQRRRTAN